VSGICVAPVVRCTAPIFGPELCAVSSPKQAMSVLSSTSCCEDVWRAIRPLRSDARFGSFPRRPNASEFIQILGTQLSAVVTCRGAGNSDRFEKSHADPACLYEHSKASRRFLTHASGPKMNEYEQGDQDDHAFAMIILSMEVAKE
jgi:hypothetical protein